MGKPFPFYQIKSGFVLFRACARMICNNIFSKFKSSRGINESFIDFIEQWNSQAPVYGMKSRWKNSRWMQILLCAQGMWQRLHNSTDIVAYLSSFRNINLNVILEMCFTLFSMGVCVCVYLCGVMQRFIHDLCEVWLFRTTRVIEPEEITLSEALGFSSLVTANASLNVAACTERRKTQESYQV